MFVVFNAASYFVQPFFSFFQFHRFSSDMKTGPVGPCFMSGEGDGIRPFPRLPLSVAITAFHGIVYVAVSVFRLFFMLF